MEELVIGCGTWIGFDCRPGSAEHARLAGVLEALFATRGTLIDSSPMYGQAEANVGALLPTVAPPEKVFLATKVWTIGREAGIAQMEKSLQCTQRGELGAPVDQVVRHRQLLPL